MSARTSEVIPSGSRFCLGSKLLDTVCSRNEPPFEWHFRSLDKVKPEKAKRSRRCSANGVASSGTPWASKIGISLYSIKNLSESRETRQSRNVSGSNDMRIESLSLARHAASSILGSGLEPDARFLLFCKKNLKSVVVPSSTLAFFFLANSSA